MIKIDKKEKCCGCTACASICPVNAITMTPDEEGFLYPVVDEVRCVDCGRCETVCPIVQKFKLPEDHVGAFVAQSKEKEILNECTSGGFADAANRYVIECLDGCAIGVAFDDAFLPSHTIADSYHEAKKFRNSKYAQSDLRGVFPRVRQLLENGKVVLFTGTPCQVAGLKSFLKKDFTNLICIDLVCRSVPSPRLWREYLEWQEQKYNSKIGSIACRKKTYGYHSGALEIEFENGRHYSGSNRVDYYMKLFHHDVCARPSCYSCAFKTQHRCSDITLFDSWNAAKIADEAFMDNDLGFTNVLVHTKKGHELVKKIESVRYYETTPEKMFRYTGGMEKNSVIKPETRESFYSDLGKMGFFDTAKKYVSVTMIDILIERLKPFKYALQKYYRKQ